MAPTLPNILTVLRLLAAPALPLVFLALPRPFADWVALVLFIGASVTDYVDGWLARAWGQESRFGAMLDPIADKAMIFTALLAMAALWGLSALVLIPATLILFREVFVSGLREYLGSHAGTLKVTRLAKWKTTLQMVALSLLFAAGIAEHATIVRIVGMTPEMAQAVISGVETDEVGLRLSQNVLFALQGLGLAVLWLAAVLTLVTGWEYFRKALPFLKEPA